MIDAFVQGLFLVLQWKAFGFMLLGIGIGFWVGLLPGLGGATTLALMLPFIYNMQPVEAFAFLLGMHSVVATTGDVTSILFGVPGEATTAAIILDGHAMAKKGEAGRALGAALASSLIGALVGAAALAVAIPVVRPLVLTFGSPELFMLAIVGLAFIASLSAEGPRGMLRGFLAGGLGLFLAMVGQDPQAGVARFTLDTLYLWQGLDLVPVLVGLFAIPEIIDLVVRGTSIAGNVPAGRISHGALEGVKDVFRHWQLTIRCALIGTFVGITPGLGGAGCVQLSRLTALTAVPGHLLVPVILVLVFIGSYTSNSSYADIVVTLVFGAVGYFMVLAGWPRAPLVLGLVLGKIAENYLYISVARYDAGWLTRPVVLVLLAIAIGVIFYPAIQAWRARRRHA